MSDSLPPDLADALAAAGTRLPDEVVLQYFDEVDSTNDIALALAEAGAPSGTAVIANVQRLGRGRRGRVWHSPAGAGLYLSCVIRASASPLALLTLAAGVAAGQAIRLASGLPVELKWPNDVVVGRPWRKLGGILCETAGAGARVDAVVVGIGVNLRAAAYPSELRDRATAIETELGRPIERAPLAVECLVRLIELARELEGGRTAGVVAAWRELAAAGLDGAAVRWQDHRLERRGRARGVDVDGALLVECGGRLERITSGEVTWDLST